MNRFRLNVDSLESREVPAALPVLLVIADQQDFFYQEYGDTRNALEANGVPVVVAATTTNPSTPHPGSGQGANSGVVVPNIALANVNPDNYSAIAFVGGWGASMYQYAYNDPDLNGTTNNFYQNSFYNGDSNLNDGAIAPQKVVVNNLINEFLDSDKPVAGVCHGTTVLAWARVDGVSPLAGKRVAVPLVAGTPAMTYNGTFRNAGFPMGQYIQAQDVGAYAFNVSGQYGNPATVADDVIVDGRIITAQDNNAAYAFGQAIAATVNADANLGTPMAPTVNTATAPQRSRVTNLTVTFDAPLDAAMLNRPGAVTLSNGSRLLQTGNFAAGRIIVSPSAGMTDSVNLTFSNNLASVLEGGSLTDGVWNLSIPAADYNTTIRRLYGDIDANGTVDSTDMAVFGNSFGQTLAGSPVDFDNNGTIDSNDLSHFGFRFGRSL